MKNAPHPSSPLKILRVITRLNVGGPALLAILLTNQFKNEGWASELVTGSVGVGESSMEDLARERGVVPIHIPDLSREIHPWKDFSALWKLVRILHQFKPDILHTDMAKAGALGRIAGFIFRRGHLRGLWTPRPLKIYHTFHGHVLRGYFPHWKERLFCLAEWLLGRLSTKLITLSPGLRSELINMGVAPPDKIQVIPLGIELDPFLAVPEEIDRKAPLRKELAVGTDAPLVGIVGRLVPIKDHDTFLQAASCLGEKVGTGRAKEAHFVIVGGGDLRGAIEKKANALGLGERCHFLGWRTDLAEIYQGLDLVALTSRNEGTPVSLIEAMAAARPVVATRVGGVPDVMGAEEKDLPGSTLAEGTFQIVNSGALAESGDALGLARAMNRFLNDKDLSREVGRKARNRATALHAIQRMKNRLADLYLAD